MFAQRSLFFGLLFWVFACGSVAAQDLVTQRAYLEDPQGVMTLAQVKSAEFSESGKIISLGYTRATVWVRLDLMQPADAEVLAVRLFPAHLDDVVLFSDALPHEGLRLSGRTTWFASQSGNNVYYLRIKNKGPMLLAPWILSETQAQAEDVGQGVLMGAVLTCSVLVLGWLLFLAVRRRQMLHDVLFVNFCLVVALFFAWTGHVHAWLQGDVISVVSGLFDSQLAASE